MNNVEQTFEVAKQGSMNLLTDSYFTIAAEKNQWRLTRGEKKELYKKPKIEKVD